MKKTNLTLHLVCMLLIVLLAGCGAPAGSGGAGDASPTPDAGELERLSIHVEMIMGNDSRILLGLDHEAAPKTVENFVKLVEDGFYDGLTIHRVSKGFVIQGGDPDGNGTGGPGYTIEGEFSSNGWENPISHTEGVLSMARKPGDPNSAGSQFFIMLADATSLDGDYAAFGRVLEGMDVVASIGKVETDANERPLSDITIKSMKVVE